VPNEAVRRTGTMKKKTGLMVAVFVALVLLVVPSGAAAQQFFGGKVIRIIAGYPPGGGVDTEARLIARHVGKFIPGNPNVIVENMSGAGGRIALNHVSRVAKKDGLTWIVIPSTPLIFQLLDKDRKFDLKELLFLRGSSEPGITVARDITGVKTFADLAKADAGKLVIPGRSAPDGPQMALRAALDLVGIKSGYKTSLGYAGTAKITAALLQGEATFYEWAMLNVLKGGILYDPIQEGKVIPLWQTGQLSPKGEVVRDARIDMPTFEEAYRKTVGKPPSGVAYQAYKALGPGVRTLNRSAAMTPGVPPERAKILQAAFDKMDKDPEYAAELKRILGFEAETFSGDDALEILDGFLKGVTPEVLSYMKSIAQ
jgi:tripartite-type tricarboxylate transporter receptor subunit TctC